MLYRGVNMTNAMGDEEEDGIRLASSTGAAPSPPKHSFIRFVNGSVKWEPCDTLWKINIDLKSSPNVLMN